MSVAHHHDAPQQNHAVHKFVSPFLDECAASSCDASSVLANSVNGGMSNLGASQPLQQEQDQQRSPSAGGMVSRAASHVSLAETPGAHEYRPVCDCADCQNLIRDYTAYDILDAYVVNHLGYEKTLAATYGFVPAIGGPHGNVAMRLDATGTGQPAQDATPETTNALFFFSHNATQRPVPANVRQRSLNHFYDCHQQGHQQQQQGHQQQYPQYQEPVKPHTKAGRFHNNGHGHGQQQQHRQFRSHNNYGQQQVNINYNQQSQQQQFHNDNNGYGAAAARQHNAPHYTAADVELVRQAAAYNADGDRLGQ